MKKRLSLRNSQDGVVSIIVVIMIILMLTLIVLAMATNARHEQRQALDRQLSDQAFYNAESGINDTINYLFTTPTAPIDKLTDCDTSFLGGGVIDASGTNKYTCILYNKAPPTIEFDNIGISDSKVVPIESLDNAGNPVPLINLTISWDDAGGNNTVSGCNFTAGAQALPASLPVNCTVGAVRADLIAAQPNRDLLAQRVFNVFGLPHASAGGSITVLSGYPENQGNIGQARCNGSPGPRTCNLTITNINANKLYLHIRSIYKPTDISISGTDAGGTAVRFKDAQIMIDATGKATDILRRVQVRVGAQTQYTNAEFSLQSRDSICKLLDVENNSGTRTVTSADTVRCPVN